MKILIYLFMILPILTNAYKCNTRNTNRMRFAIANGLNISQNKIMVYCTHDNQFDYTIKEYHCTALDVENVKESISVLFNIDYEDVKFDCKIKGRHVF